MEKLLFKKPLREGVIKSRPNRFIFMVEIKGKIVKCHCPSTGQIASLEFKDIPCLLSESENPDRKTKFTAEAISLDSVKRKNKNWIGINQTKANQYIEFFLRTKQLKKLFPKIVNLKREVKLSNSRIDFLINERDYLEVKTPLKDIPSEQHPNYKKRESDFISFDRLVKHFNDISKSIKHNSRAIFLICFIYNAEIFNPPKKKAQLKIIRAAKKARARGLENWQINLKIDKSGVSLIRYCKLKLF
jgi:sugar fermentation stimulation protein A